MKCALDCEGDWSCHVDTDAGKLVYLKGKKMEQYDPIIKRRLSVYGLKTSHLVFRFVRKMETLLFGFRITVMILISRTEKFFHLTKPDSLFGKN